MNLKNQKNWAFFDPSRPINTQNGSGYRCESTNIITGFFHIKIEEDHFIEMEAEAENDKIKVNKVESYTVTTQVPLV